MTHKQYYLYPVPANEFINNARPDAQKMDIDQVFEKLFLKMKPIYMKAKPILRPQMLLAVALLLAGAIAGNCQRQHQKQKPNIIFILADDLGYGDVRTFNPKGKIATPNIDRLASQGMKFTDAHSSSAVCTPSRYSILTGRYPWRSTLQKGVLGGFSKPLIKEDKLTVASFLQKSGYYTAVIGKWHLGLDWQLKPGNKKIKTGWEIDYAKPFKSGPLSLGFDYFYGISASLDMPPFIFLENDHSVGLPTITKKIVRTGPTEKNFKAEDVVPFVARKTQQLITQRHQTDQPFFIYMALPSPHTPIAPSEQFKGKSGMTEYGDYVQETDWAVGQVLHTLDSLGIAGNTMVVFTSDNGFAPYVLKQFDVEQLGHFPSYIFRGYKADIWEGGHHIPLVIRWPDIVKAGQVSNDLVSLTDFMATTADVLGKKLPADQAVDSYSMLPDIIQQSTKPIRPAIVYLSIDGNFALQEGKWKLELCPGSGGWGDPRNRKAYLQGLPPIQLYDMENDIREQNNVAAAHPDIVKSLTAKLKSYIDNGRSTVGPKQQNEVSVDLWKEVYKKDHKTK